MWAVGGRLRLQLAASTPWKVREETPAAIGFPLGQHGMLHQALPRVGFP